MWIAVHESIDGGKLEKLRDTLGCSKYEAVGILVLFWLWGQENTDEKGRFKCGLRTLDTAFVNHMSGSNIRPDRIVSALVSTGWVDINGGVPKIHDWEDWEKKWNSAVERKTKKAKNGGAEMGGVNREQIGIGGDVAEDEIPEKGKTSYTEDFEEFWSVYPRPISKRNAFRVYNTRLKEGYSPNQMYKAANNYAYECRKRHTSEIYIKHPATFLGPDLHFLEYLGTDGNGGTQEEDDALPFAVE